MFSKNTGPKVTISYFPAFAGRAGALYAACYAGNITFDFDAVEELKDRELQTAPEARINDQVFAQSNAALVYLGRLGSTMPADHYDEARVIEYLSTVEDMYGAFGAAIRAVTKSEDERKKVRAEFVEKLRTRYFPFLERRLRANGSGYLVGKKLTVADLKVYYFFPNLLSGNVDHVDPATLLEGFPLIADFVKKIANEPCIKKTTERLVQIKADAATKKIAGYKPEKITLRYGPFGGRVAPLRACLAHGDVEYEFDSTGFAKASEARFKTMPQVIVDGVTIAQSNAALTLLGGVVGLMPSAPLERASVEEVLGACEDFLGNIGPSFSMKGDEQKKVRLAWVARMRERYLPFTEEVLGKASYLVGGALTVADLKMYYSLSFCSTLDHVSKDALFDGFPKTSAWMERMAAEPCVVKYAKIEADMLAAAKAEKEKPAEKKTEAAAAAADDDDGGDDDGDDDDDGDEDDGDEDEDGDDDDAAAADEAKAAPPAIVEAPKETKEKETKKKSSSSSSEKAATPAKKSASSKAGSKTATPKSPSAAAKSSPKAGGKGKAKK